MTEKSSTKKKLNKLNLPDAKPHEVVSLHYPKPTALSTVLNDVALWSEFNFVLEPKLNRKIQIFAPRKLKKTDAFHLFLASVEAIGLRIVLMDGKVAKVVPQSLGKVAV